MESPRKEGEIRLEVDKIYYPSLDAVTNVDKSGFEVVFKALDKAKCSRQISITRAHISVQKIYIIFNLHVNRQWWPSGLSRRSFK